MNKFIQMVLNFGTDDVVLDRNVQSKYDPQTGVLDIRWDLTAAELGVMVRERYESGDTHEEVTAWLERVAPQYKKVLSECFSEDGHTYWAITPSSICFTLTIDSSGSAPV